MRHIPEDELEAYAGNPAAVPNRAGIEAHLNECKTCRTDLAFERACRDAVTWLAAIAVRGEDPELNRILDLAERAEAEDREAREVLDPLLENPLRFIWSDAARDERIRTAGGVRVLCAEANRQCEQNPRHALRLADVATLIAESLSPEEHYLGQHVYLLRGLAWKERANALRFRGNLPAALEAIERADREYARARVAVIDRAILERMRAITLAESERFDEAETAASRAADTFASCGDLARYLQARNDQANIAYYRADYPACVAIWNEILPIAEDLGDDRMIAAIASNAGHASLLVSDTLAAAPLLHRALVLFEKLALPVEVLRTRWGLDCLLLIDGNAEEAARRLRFTAAEFERLGSANDALLVTLDHIDALLVLERTDEAARLCRGLVQRFKNLGLTNSALRALGYLRELAVHRQLARPEVRHVRKFVERLQRNPALLFLPPDQPTP